MKKTRKIILSNLIGILNALVCGISIPLINMRGFSFPMISEKDVPSLTIIMIIWSTVLYLIQNLFTVNLINYFLSKIKKISLGIVLLGAILSNYAMIFVLAGKEAINLIGVKIPEAVWITTIIYTIGFYFLIIRKSEEKPMQPPDVEIENVTISKL